MPSMNFEDLLFEMKRAAQRGPVEEFLARSGLGDWLREVSIEARQLEGLLTNMTKQERQNPMLLMNPVRRAQLAKAVGVDPNDVSILVSTFLEKQG